MVWKSAFWLKKVELNAHLTWLKTGDAKLWINLPLSLTNTRNLNFIANISILLPLDKKFKRYLTLWSIILLRENSNQLWCIVYSLVTAKLPKRNICNLQRRRLVDLTQSKGCEIIKGSLVAMFKYCCLIFNVVEICIWVL